MCKVKLNYNNNDFYQEFSYCENSPSGIIRNSTGLPAGTLRVTKKEPLTSAWFVKYKSVAYAVHRIIYFLKNGFIDEMLVVDHIDGNSTNNKIKNLRLTTQLVNNRNHKKQSNNKTGITGIYYEERNGHSRYRVTWEENGKKSKSFSCKKYGKKTAFKLAKEFRNNKIKQLSYYTIRHGK